ncbi:MAG: iron ABC transporter permease [Rhodothermales bacterium]|nr:iron ABC transporter permease [Rhodothermales bacterium]
MAIVLVGLAIPLLYLVVRALSADPERTIDLVLSSRNLELLSNTLLLAFGVLAGSSILALPLAWLTTRTDLPQQSIVTTIGVLPLAVPGYVLAYVILGTTGSYGSLARYAGIDLPTLDGYWGALTALSIYLSPYMFLNVRSALLSTDDSLEEAARSLGQSRLQVLLRVTLPQLRPAFAAGAVLVVLHVMGDFGVVSLMRFETFSLAIYLQFVAAFDRTYAAILALALLAISSVFLIVEARALRNTTLHRAGGGPPRSTSILHLGRWKPVALLYCGAFATVTVVFPVASIVAWAAGSGAGMLTDLTRPLINAVEASGLAAAAAALLAVPVAWLRVRRPSLLTRSVERAAYLGYALPPLALALAYIFFALGAFPAIYQTLALLVFAYTLHFLAEAIGPVRAALYHVSPNVEEAARSLGHSPLRAFTSTTLPLLRNGIVVSLTFVFLSALKELPLTIILSPPGFETLSTNVWSFANEAMFARAAPYALAIVTVSAVFVGILLRRDVPTPQPRYIAHE